MWCSGSRCLDLEDRRQKTEDEHPRKADQEPDPGCGEGDLAHRCVHGLQTPDASWMFRPANAKLVMGRAVPLASAGPLLM